MAAEPGPVMTEFRASAPGKLILFGEHAVVYGTLAIAGALSSLRVCVSVVRVSDPSQPSSSPLPPPLPRPNPVLMPPSSLFSQTPLRESILRITIPNFLSKGDETEATLTSEWPIEELTPLLLPHVADSGELGKRQALGKGESGMEGRKTSCWGVRGVACALPTGTPLLKSLSGSGSFLSHARHVEPPLCCRCERGA
jgi:hypothetical protein